MSSVDQTCSLTVALAPCLVLCLPCVEVQPCYCKHMSVPGGGHDQVWRSGGPLLMDQVWRAITNGPALPMPCCAVLAGTSVCSSSWSSATRMWSSPPAPKS